ncbi:hypothetical protein [Sphingobacterium faecale]|uniref:Yip1 domain-containing protein n=1 Tax=Sphingobacterium faecale TaxID=2803775 RepID=A0ABS1R7C3_9SPHI|nr:hypothetical protein [Sphingobacterium faecale]MBL1410611.1 hypothetical protein [Sphingobacterium faecale]
MANVTFNPFVDSSEKKLLLIGFIGFAFAVVLTNYSDTLMLGSLKLVHVKPKEWYSSLYNLGFTIIANTLLLYFFALIRFSRTRFVDVLNTVLIAHFGMYVLLLVSSIPVVADFLKSIEFMVLDHIDDPSKIPLDKIILMLIFGFFSIGCLIVFFILLTMGMKIAMNSKKGGDTVIIVLLVLLLNTLLQFLNLYI